jgi:hypothetical protein
MPESFELLPTAGSRAWFAGRTIPYDDVTKKKELLGRL